MTGMHSNVYLDESGDLGWTFNKPYRNGGSSKYLTIAYFVCPITHKDIPKRLVRNFYDKFGFNPREEIKASMLKKHHKDFICSETIKMLDKYPDFHLGAATVNKTKVEEHIKNDGNLLYHYVISKSVLEVVKGHITCKLTRDNRTVKQISGSSCIDYLQTQMWFVLEAKTILKDNPTDSHTDDGIIFIDWITNIVWSKYEDNYTLCADLLKNHITEINLFF
jgi:Protein of unknown function (DUF3800)